MANFPGRRRIPTELGMARARLRTADRRTMVRHVVLAAVAFAAAFVLSDGGPALSAAAGVVIAAALPARWVWPSLALLSVSVLPASLAILFALPMAAYGVGRRVGPSRRRTGVLGVASALVLAVPFVWSDEDSWEITAISGATSMVLLLLLPAGLGIVAGERASRLSTLRERNALLEQAHRLSHAQAVLQERTRIAGEMHDLLGHRLSLIALYAGALEMRTQAGGPDMGKEAALVRTTAKTALDELRGILGILRVDAQPRDAEGPDDDLGTRADLEGLVEASRHGGLPVELRWSGDDLAGIDAHTRRAVHRVAREALTNAHKHAPQSRTLMSVNRDAAQVCVQVSSELAGNGSATPRAPGTGLGLVGLRERVRLAGGTFSAGPEEHGARFVVTAQLPTTPPTRPPHPAAVEPHDGTELTGASADRAWSHGAGPDGDWAGVRGTRSGEGGIGPPALPAAGPGRGMKDSTKIVLIVVAGVLVLLLGAVALLGYELWSWTREMRTIPAATYKSVELGRNREQVERQIGDSSPLARETVTADEPAVPTGAGCSYVFTAPGGRSEPTAVYRFCFVDGTLIEKKRIPIPEETPSPGGER
ncbi:sensor histidine kinase [Streptomyces sp. MS2.AVA.5]|uniref:Histidine kinase n=1 Tax=Streptomyces achmelvichensis TaxID=3134111 RepID=A0ACC6Q7F2_9ACTN